MKQYKNSVQVKVGAIHYASLTSAIQAIIKRSYKSKKGIKSFKDIADMMDCKIPYVTYAYKRLVKTGQIEDCYRGKRGFGRYV